jgi:sulfur relay (sulfurtransferase) DsrF/TusC family protein
MVNVVIDISHPPFGHENTFAGLYVATASLSKGMDAIVILRGDGVFTGRKGQVDPMENINLPPTETQLEDVLELDGRIIAAREALLTRGIGTDELVDGIEILDTQEIHDIILDHGDKVVTF